VGNLSPVFAKPSAAGDAKIVVTWLRQNASAALDALIADCTKLLTDTLLPIAPPRADVVEEYNSKLEAALGNEPNFKSVMAELESDINAGAAELIALSKRFAHASVKSKTAAQKKIQNRHDQIVGGRAWSRNTGRRIAGG
jgi:hypothetical protein